MTRVQRWERRARALMLVGIAVVGAVTASVATVMVGQVQKSQAA